MSVKIRSTITRRQEAAIEAVEFYSDFSGPSSYFSYGDNYFPQTEYPIGPIFQFTLASSLKNQRELSKLLRLSPTDNVIRFDSGWWNRNLIKVLEIINGKIAIRNRKYIQHLAIDFTNFHEVSFWRSMIADIAKSFPSVRFLYINLEKSFPKKLTDGDLIWLSHHLTTYMPNLKHLSLRLFESSEIPDDHFSVSGFKRFCKQIGRRLKRLETFSLDFGAYKESAKFFKSLSHLATSHLRHLKDFRIILPDHLQSDSVFREMRFDKRRYLKQLEILDLYLNGTPYSDKLLSVQERVLNQKVCNTTLQHLRLYFSPFTHTADENWLENFTSSCLSHVSNLKNFNLHFENLSIDSKLFGAFMQALKDRIKTLDQFQFCCRNTLGIIAAFFDLFECPEDNNLKKLSLRFEGYIQMLTRETATTLPEFSFTTSFLRKSLGNLKNLTHLDLHFEVVTIKDEHVEGLMLVLTDRLSKLESLKIKFMDCPEITNVSVKALREGLCSETVLPDLKALSLTFIYCWEVSQIEVETLKESLEDKKPNLESTIVYGGDYTDSSCSLCPDDISKGCLKSKLCQPYYLEPSPSSDEDLSDFLEDKDFNDDDDDDDDDDDLE